MPSPFVQNFIDSCLKRPARFDCRLTNYFLRSVPLGESTLIEFSGRDRVHARRKARRLVVPPPRRARPAPARFSRVLPSQRRPTHDYVYRQLHSTLIRSRFHGRFTPSCTTSSSGVTLRGSSRRRAAAPSTSGCRPSDVTQAARGAGRGDARAVARAGARRAGADAARPRRARRAAVAARQRAPRACGCPSSRRPSTSRRRRDGGTRTSGSTPSRWCGSRCRGRRCAGRRCCTTSARCRRGPSRPTVACTSIGTRRWARACSRTSARRFRFDKPIKQKLKFLILHHLRPNQYDASWTDSAVRRFDRELQEHLDRSARSVARRHHVGAAGQAAECAAQHQRAVGAHRSSCATRTPRCRRCRRESAT